MITAFPEIKIENLDSDCDFIILGCDGIWECLNNQEICDLIIKKIKEDSNIKLSKIIEEIFDSILGTYTYDDNDNDNCISDNSYNIDFNIGNFFFIFFLFHFFYFIYIRKWDWI
jgi:hypothetical protein